MIGELTKAAGEVAKNVKNFDGINSFDPDKKAEISNKDSNKKYETNNFDPDKKAEVSKESDVNGTETKSPKEIHTRNESLEEKNHPETGVPFERKIVKDADGNEVTGVFPEFDSKFDAQLPEDLYQGTDKEQFAECNRQLKEKVENAPEFAKKFTPEQLEQIKNGDTPDGYTWHHNEETGKMQLVDSDVHAKTGHTGGKTIWGGGNENR